MLSRPVSCGKRVQALHFGLPRAVSQKAERLGNNERIVDLLLVDVRLSDENQRRSRLALEQRFHGGQRDRLMFGDHSALPVPGGKQLHNAEDQPAITPTRTKIRPCSSNFPHSR